MATGVVAGVLASAAPAVAAGPSFSVGTGCQEQQAWVEGDDAAVAARLPDGYEPVRSPGSGAPLLFVRALRCSNMTLDGRDADAAIVANYGVVIETPDGLGCGSATPVVGPYREGPPICNWWPVATLTDDRRVARWLGDELATSYVPGLAFEWRDFDPARGGRPGHFRAPAFTIDTLTRERAGELSVRGGYWAETPGGTFKLAIATDELISSDGSATVNAEPGSELAELLGATERSTLPPWSGFTAQRFDHGVYRKQWLAPAEGAHSFAGSCSVEGTVTFSPPAKNEPQALTYDYEATGTCTGTLDGREVSDAPVTDRRVGTAEGGCRSALTTAPGRGTLTFADGTTITYTLDFKYTSTEGNVMLYGDRSGTAHGTGTFLTRRSSPAVSRQCGGDGAEKVPMDAAFTTHSPLVSEERRGAPGAARRGTVRRRGRRTARVVVRR